MIHIINNYYAVPNNMGFTLVQDKGKLDKDGNKICVTIGYCGDIAEVCWLACKIVEGEGDMRLAEAIQNIKETEEKIHKILEGLRGRKNN